MGDSVIGEGVNIGAGTITCNYDGAEKHQTIIGDGVFVGSNVELVAPVKVGKNAVIGAGTTVTRDVPDGSLAISRTKQKNIEGWGARMGELPEGMGNRREGGEGALTPCAVSSDTSAPERRPRSLLMVSGDSNTGDTIPPGSPFFREERWRSGEKKANYRSSKN